MNIGAIRIGSRNGKSLRKRDRLMDIRMGRRTGRKVGRGIVYSDDEDEEMEDAIDPEAVEKQRKEQQEQEEDDADSDYEYLSDSSSEDTQSVDSNDSDLLTRSSEILDVALRPRTPEPEPVEEVDDGGWSQDSELDISDEWGLDNYASTENTEEDSFDPRLVGLDDVMWINRVRALALNPERKAYISGRGRYSDYGSLDIEGPGRDPNDPGEYSLNITSYASGDEQQAFPFHEACFDILAKSIGLEKGRDIDKDVMCRTFSALLVDERPVLDVDYQLHSDQGQFWHNEQGTEYEVCDPSPRPALQESIQDILPANIFGGSPQSANLAHKVRSDPTTVLPYDLLHEILGYVDSKDMLSFMKASYHVNSVTREAAFWKHMLRMRILPWFYELRYFVETATTDALDYKDLFLWVDASTRPRFGNQGPLMHIANRRRIWGCCQPVASLYKKATGPVEPAEPADSEEAKAILDSSLCLHMPMTMYPPPAQTETVSAQFIHSWNEITHRACVLDTYWRHINNSDDYLVGISVTLGDQTRLFGSSDGFSGLPFHLDRGEWIKEIVCCVESIVNQTGPHGKPEDPWPSKTAMISGISGYAGVRRPFQVLDGMHLVGMTGQIASNGAISRLGLLQACGPDSAPLAQPRYTSAQQMAWGKLGSSLPYDRIGQRYPQQASVWAHPTIHFESFPASTHPNPYELPEDMMPNDVFMWSKKNTGIECFQPIATNLSMAKDSTEDPMQSTSATPATTALPSSLPATNTSSSSYQLHTGIDIVGINPGPHDMWGNRGRSVGSRGPVLCQSPKWAHDMTEPLRESLKAAWQDMNKTGGGPHPNQLQNTVTFPLNQEDITEVHVEQQYRALKLVTQSGRVGYFGEPDMRDWFVRKAVGGEQIVGISACFGALGGWSESARMWSHLKLSRVGVVFERVDGEGRVIGKEEEKEMREKGVVFDEGKVVMCSE
ncbi:hypothetical protein J4E93_009077 [Alternaria ventricosa]|uniref:uncharacterized protein n=1 Tax=Alternaria ventricosa TaxID=1187951 RepID=UPI0020C3937B|nr:uncharacterized protein J4E93_009077 [Alternaria ventricosa]KAI4639723.1 hypothetical protein J4E93_009077 [Alternaria ventricosa]